MMASQHLNYHNISFLRSTQKIILSRYLTSNEIPKLTRVLDDSESVQMIYSIFRYLLGYDSKKVVSEEKFITLPNTIQKTKKLDGFTVPLLELVHTLLQEQKGPSPHPKSTRLPRPSSNYAVEPKIKVFQTSEDSQYPNLLQFMKSRGIQTIRPQQLFFGTQTSTIYDIKKSC